MKKQILRSFIIISLMLFDTITIFSQGSDSTSLKNYVSVDPFSIANNHITISYERILQNNQSLNIDIAKIGLFSKNYDQQHPSGFFVRSGYRFYTKKVKQNEGFFLEPSVAYTSFTHAEITVTTFNDLLSGTTEIIPAGKNTSIAATLNIGASNKFLNEKMAIEYWAGAGFTENSQKELNNYYSHIGHALCFNAGLQIGFGF